MGIRTTGGRYSGRLLCALLGSVCGTPAGAVDEFYETAIEHRGYEQIVAGPNVNAAFGLRTTANYAAVDVALSGDGRQVWFVLYREFATPRHEVWRIGADASAAQKSTAPTTVNASSVGNILFVQTDRDGSVAMLDSSTQFWRALPGQTLQLLFNLDAANFSLADGQVRINDAGDRALFLDRWNKRVFSVDLGSANPTATVLASGTFFNYLNVSPRGMEGFDMAADARDWFTAGENHYFDVNRQRFWINHGMGLSAPTRLIENVQGDDRRLLPIEASDNGLTFAYCHYWTSPNSCFVQQAAATSRVQLSDGAYNLGGIVLADDASRAYLISSFGSGSAYGYFQLANGSRRWIVGSQRLAGFPSPTFFRVKLSDDGKVLAAPTALGVYVLHDGSGAPSTFPRIEQIVQRYDAVRDELVVRVQVNAPDGIERIFTLPMYRGLEPTRYVDAAQNPLFNERSGGGVNFSTVFAAVSGQPGWWERRIGLGGKRQFLSSDYQLRLVLVDHTGHRTAFYDFTPSLGADTQVQAVARPNAAARNGGSDSVGRYVVVQTSADNLDSNDRNGLADIYRIDTRCAEGSSDCTRTQRVSLDDAEAGLTRAATEPSLSANGQLVVFVVADAGVAKLRGESVKAAAARRKGPGWGVYLRNLLTGSTQRVGNASGETGVLPRIAPDGAAVVFTSTNTDSATGTPGQNDVYHVALARSGAEFVPQPATQRCVSCKTIDSQGRDTATASNGPSGHPVVSADGAVVAWESTAANVLAISACPMTPVQVMLRNMLTATTQMIGMPANAQACGAANAGTRAPSLDYSGSRIAIESDRALLGGDDNAAPDVYLVDTAARATRWVSQADDGSAGNAGSSQPSLSGDGKVVAFVSAATDIDSRAADTNNQADLYVRAVNEAAVRRLSTTSVGDQANGASLRPALSYNGTQVLFDSDASNLAGAATAGQLNVYQRVNPLYTTRLFAAGFE